MAPSAAEAPCRVGGYEPSVRVEGGAGAPLIFVPGMDGTGRLFHTQVPLLARDFRVATYALRDDADDMETLVDDLRRALDVLAPGGEPAVVVAESFGGTVAMSFALAHPERVRELVIVNSFSRLRSPAHLRVAIAATRVMPWRLMGVFRRLTVARLHAPDTPPAEIAYFLEQTRGVGKRAYLSRLRILAEYDLRSRLGELRVPTLFVASDQDRLVPAVEEASYMAARVPGAALRVLPGRGHRCLIAPGVDLAQIIRESRG